MKRTHLPLNGLRVLDAAARHLSFTRAADELAVTPAAVGQQIRALEDMLGVVLFRRTSRGLELTPETLAGLDALRSGFLMFEDAVQAMQAGQASSMIAIAAPRDITAHWLQPRLRDYGLAHPQMRFTLIAAEDALDFAEANIDIALRLAEGPGDHEGVALAPPDYVKVAGAGPMPDDAAMARIDWPGCPLGDPPASLRVADAGLAMAAAMNGMGWAMVPRLLAQGAVARGDLREIAEPMAGPRGYWLIAPLPQWRQKKVRALVDALTR